MILNYDYIEIWETDKLIEVPKHLKTGIHEIVTKHHEDKKIKENPYNLETSFRPAKKSKTNEWKNKNSQS